MIQLPAPYFAVSAVAIGVMASSLRQAAAGLVPLLLDFGHGATP